SRQVAVRTVEQSTEPGWNESPGVAQTSGYGPGDRTSYPVPIRRQHLRAAALSPRMEMSEFRRMPPMRQITSTEWLVLNATADDAENLEQIYRSLAFECSADPNHSGDSHAYHWREARPPVLLSEIADAIQSLVVR